MAVALEALARCAVEELEAKLLQDERRGADSPSTLSIGDEPGSPQPRGSVVCAQPLLSAHEAI